MKKIQLFITSIFLFFAIQSVAMAQTSNITEMFKTHFNETVQNVHGTVDAEEKRSILNHSYSKMITALDRIELKTTLSDDEIAQLYLLKEGIVEKQNELNGMEGFNKIQDEELVDFTDYSQQYFEQANRTLTISVTTALLIIIIILLLS